MCVVSVCKFWRVAKKNWIGHSAAQTAISNNPCVRSVVRGPLCAVRCARSVLRGPLCVVSITRINTFDSVVLPSNALFADSAADRRPPSTSPAFAVLFTRFAGNNVTCDVVVQPKEPQEALELESEHRLGVRHELWAKLTTSLATHKS